MARLSLYLIGIAAGVAAIVTYRNRDRNAIVNARPNSIGRLPVQQAADMLRQAWAAHHTRV
ncbi:MAG TPA: hypothetical protein VGJ21_16000 [Terracidiphilus sp.]|jgi:hypothetical protein